MDGPHDLGGREGFGPIDTAAPDFRHDWERRQWALSKNVPITGLNIDQSRFIIEAIPPAHYLAAPYFEKWCLRDLAMLVIAGAVTRDEAAAGHAERRGDPPPARDVDDAVAAVRANLADFSRPAETRPRFATGDRVRTVRHGHAGHTRLPAYARAAEGRVAAHHGAHLFPDAMAAGKDLAHHLYTVEFAATALWGPAADPRDIVALDLWEPYLEPA